MKLILLLKIITPFLLIIFGMFLNALFESPIQKLTDKMFLNKEPDVKITFNGFNTIQNIWNVTNLISERGFKIGLDSNGNNWSIEKDPYNGEITLHINGLIINGQAYGYSHLHQNGLENLCVFEFPLHLKSEGLTKFVVDHGGISAAIDLVYNKPSNCNNCVLKTFYAHNFGDKKLTDFKTEVCMDGFVKHTTDDVRITNYNCVEIRSSDLLPQDTIGGLVYVEEGTTDITSFSAYSEDYGTLPDNRFLYKQDFIFRDC